MTSFYPFLLLPPSCAQYKKKRSLEKLVVSGQRRAKEKYAQAVAIYDLGTGEQISFYKFKGSRQAMGVPLVLSDGVIIPSTKGLMKIDMNLHVQREYQL